MFAWYKASAFCIAYLSDVRTSYHAVEFCKARWFTRGWTLPELIAPRKVLFYDQDWHFIGSKSERLSKIAQITGIDPFVLGGGYLSHVPVARHMLWASGRKTTRPEDMVYSLLGLFNVNMPMLYGEGVERAFLRLQQEIVLETDDKSLFAWQDKVDWQTCDWVFDSAITKAAARIALRATSLFAKSPSDFEHCGSMFPPLGLDFRPQSTTLTQPKRRGQSSEPVETSCEPCQFFPDPPGQQKKLDKHRVTDKHHNKLVSLGLVPPGYGDHQLHLDEDSQWETMSIISTTSTLVETPEGESANRSLLHAISFLQEDQDVASLLEPAILELGAERFQRILARLLWLMATELASEAKTKDESSVGLFLRRHRVLIASAITSGLVQSKEKDSKTETASQGEHTHSMKDDPVLHVDDDVDDVDEENIVREELEDNEDVEPVEPDQEEADFDYLPFNHFIMSSEARQNLITRVRDLAYPSFRSRAWNIPASVLKSQDAKAWSPEYKDRMKSVMALVLSELIFSRPNVVSVEDENNLSAVERHSYG